MAVQLTLPEGRTLWVPRSVIRNGHWNNTPSGAVIVVSVDRWFLLREKITPARDEEAIQKPAEATINEQYRTIMKYHEALCDIGRLTRWVGWLGVRMHENPAAADMREIKRIAEEVTGQSFEEYT